MGVHARQTKVGVNLATSGSWGTGSATATAVGAGDGHYVRDTIGIQLKMMQSEDDSAGQNFIGSVQTGFAEYVQGQLPTYLHYNDAWQNSLLALTCGTGGTAPTEIGTTTAYTNTFEPATNKTGKYATIVRDKVQYITEVPGAKFTGFEITNGDNGRMEIVWKFTGDIEKTSSTINTATQISALTFPTLGLRAFFDQCAIRINSQSGGALGAGDKVFVTALRATYTQPLDTKNVGGSTSGIEPEENGFPTFELELTFARFDSATMAWFAAHRDTSKYKADLTWTGAVIGTTTASYGLQILLPNLYVRSYEAPVTGGADQVAPKVLFRAMSTTTAPTGMTGVTAPFRVITTGVATGNPFV
jgi:hypothetical protein